MILCYQAYGLSDVVTQTLFSVVSLLRRLHNDSPLRVVIYTDMRERLAAFFAGEPRVELVEITAAEIQRWRGAINFVHRVKLEVLRDCAKRFPGPLFYCDGDTYFLQDPTPLFARVSDSLSFMHVPENKIDEGRDPLSKKIAKFLRTNEFQVGGETVKIPPSTVMWNAGVIGVSRKNCALFDPMIELTDVMHSRYQKHVMEQLAVSYYLQTRTQVERTDAAIYHYWDQKPDYQKAIDAYFARFGTLTEAVKNYDSFIFPMKAPPKPAKRGIFGFLFSRN